MRRIIAFLLVTLLAVPTGALAQAAQAQTSTPAQEQPTAGATTVDASKMGVDLSRIRRELVQAEQTQASDSPLRLSFTIQVLGTAPKIDFLEGFNVEGPLPYGSPTHSEFLDVVTPRQFRSGVFPISSLAALAAQKLWQYSKKQRCQAEIDEYRRLVMQGVPVSAPRCTQ